MIATITDSLRPYEGAIMALASATKPGGGKWTYKEILTEIGLPATAGHERAVSKLVNRKGYRRRPEFRRSNPDAVADGGLLPEETAVPGTVQDQLLGALDTLTAAIASATEAMQAIAELVNLYTPAAHE